MSKNHSPTAEDALELLAAMTTAERERLYSHLHDLRFRETDPPLLAGYVVLALADVDKLNEAAKQWAITTGLEVERIVRGTFGRVQAQLCEQLKNQRKCEDARRVVPERNKVIASLIEQGIVEPYDILAHLKEHYPHLVTTHRAKGHKPARYMKAANMMKRYRPPCEPENNCNQSD
jgi:hypothetical protein